MMDNLDKKIEYLISILKDRIPYKLDEDIVYYQELLELSIQGENFYGQALAHIKYARVYQELQQPEEYSQAANTAFEIAARENYFDIIIRYYNLEGVRYMENYDDANALSMYLKGMHTAMKVADYSLCAVLYNNIAEIFYGNYDYDRAILYYCKALDTLELVTETTPNGYRKMFTENLIVSYCLNNDVENAKKYLGICKKIPCNDHIRPYAQEEVEIRVLLLENQKEKALNHALALLKKIKESEVSGHLFFYSYSFLFDIFLDYKRREEAAFCLLNLEEMRIEISQNYAIETQKRGVRFHQTFETENDFVYKDFYEETLKWERNNTQTVSDSLSAALSLYETQKEKRLIKKERKMLEEAVMYDSLTGAYSRRRYDQIVTECMSNESIKVIAYIMIDIDFFKEYNDYYGHDRGDTILKIVSSLIQAALPEQGYLARYGGDEFSCLLVDKTVQEVNHFMKSVHDITNKEKIEHSASKNAKHLTLSMGAYYTSEKETSIATLIKRADDVLYQVKNDGRNGYRLLTEKK